MSTEASAEHAPHRLAHGQLCYLQLPARDLGRSAAFYRELFGWQVTPPDTSFEAPGLFGQFITDRPATSGTGPLVWINVDRIDDTLALARANGGIVTDKPFVDGPRWLATIQDPAGNAIGLAQHGPR